MNEELQQALIAVITSFANAMGGATDFVVAEAPEVIQQLLTWKMTVSLILFVCGLACLSATGWLTTKLAKSKSLSASKVQAEQEVARLGYEANDGKYQILGTHLTSSTYDSIMRKNREGEYADELIIPIVILGLLGIALTWESMDWLQIWLAPKVYLLEYAAELARSAS